MSRTSSIELREVAQILSGVVDEIWGPTATRDNQLLRLKVLSAFLAYCREQLDFGELAVDDLLLAIRLLKSSPQARKSTLWGEGGAVVSGAQSRASEENADVVSAESLGLAVRTMLLTACAGASSLAMGHPVIFSPRWMDSESLESYVARVYPIIQAPQQDLVSFRLEKLCADYLQSYASLQIRWTDYLSDHLILLRGESWKHVYLFRHPAFLKLALDALKADDPDLTHTTVDALKLYARASYPSRPTAAAEDGSKKPADSKPGLPAAGAPEGDADDAKHYISGHRWPCITGHPRERGKKHRLDRYFLDRLGVDPPVHRRPADALEPTNMRSLYDKYPYWADRLYELWREADDPTPITRIERWTESRRNPRFTYWCAVISIIAAVVFGILAITLGLCKYGLLTARGSTTLLGRNVGMQACIRP